MSFNFLASHYDIHLHRGQTVEISIDGVWHRGTITSATHYVFVKCEAFPRRRFKFHPTDNAYIRYIDNDQH